LHDSRLHDSRLIVIGVIGVIFFNITNISQNNYITFIKLFNNILGEIFVNLIKWYYKQIYWHNFKNKIDKFYFYFIKNNLHKLK